MFTGRLIRSLISILLPFAGMSFGRSVSLSAEDVFDAYKNAMKQSLLHRGKVAYKSEGTMSFKIPARYKMPTEVIAIERSFLSDGLRMHSHQEWEVFEDGRVASKRRVRETLMDQEHKYAVVHSMSPLEVIASTKNRLAAAFGELGAVDSAFHGYIPSDATEPL
ncbi:MAG: hypothetical protein ACYSWQ_24470, partial [Planctomycetota bacterium]